MPCKTNSDRNLCRRGTGGCIKRRQKNFRKPMKRCRILFRASDNTNSANSFDRKRNECVLFRNTSCRIRKFGLLYKPPCICRSTSCCNHRLVGRDNPYCRYRSANPPPQNADNFRRWHTRIFPPIPLRNRRSNDRRFQGRYRSLSARAYIRGSTRRVRKRFLRKPNEFYCRTVRSTNKTRRYRRGRASVDARGNTNRDRRTSCCRHHNACRHLRCNRCNTSYPMYILRLRHDALHLRDNTMSVRRILRSRDVVDIGHTTSNARNPPFGCIRRYIRRRTNMRSGNFLQRRDVSFRRSDKPNNANSLSYHPTPLRRSGSSSNPSYRRNQAHAAFGSRHSTRSARRLCRLRKRFDTPRSDNTSDWALSRCRHNRLRDVCRRLRNTSSRRNFRSV